MDYEKKNIIFNKIQWMITNIEETCIQDYIISMVDSVVEVKYVYSYTYSG